MSPISAGSTISHRLFGSGTVVQVVGNSFLLVEFRGVQHTVSLDEVKLATAEAVAHI